MSKMTNPYSPMVTSSIISTGHIKRTERLMRYIIKEYYQAYFSIEIILSEEKNWMIFVPATEVLRELIRIWNVRHKTLEYRPIISSWLLSSSRFKDTSNATSTSASIQTWELLFDSDQFLLFCTKDLQNHLLIAIKQIQAVFRGNILRSKLFYKLFKQQISYGLRFMIFHIYRTYLFKKSRGPLYKPKNTIKLKKNPKLTKDKIKTDKSSLIGDSSSTTATNAQKVYFAPNTYINKNPFPRTKISNNLSINSNYKSVVMKSTTAAATTSIYSNNNINTTNIFPLSQSSSSSLSAPAPLYNHYPYSTLLSSSLYSSESTQEHIDIDGDIDDYDNNDNYDNNNGNDDEYSSSSQIQSNERSNNNNSNSRSNSNPTSPTRKHTPLPIPLSMSMSMSVPQQTSISVPVLVPVSVSVPFVVDTTNLAQNCIDNDNDNEMKESVSVPVSASMSASMSVSRPQSSSSPYTHYSNNNNNNNNNHASTTSNNMRNHSINIPFAPRTLSSTSTRATSTNNSNSISPRARRSSMVLGERRIDAIKLLPTSSHITSTSTMAKTPKNSSDLNDNDLLDYFVSEWRRAEKAMVSKPLRVAVGGAADVEDSDDTSDDDTISATISDSDNRKISSSDLSISKAALKALNSFHAATKLTTAGGVGFGGGVSTRRLSQFKRNSMLSTRSSFISVVSDVSSDPGNEVHNDNDLRFDNDDNVQAIYEEDEEENDDDDDDNNDNKGDKVGPLPGSHRPFSSAMAQHQHHPQHQRGKLVAKASFYSVLVAEKSFGEEFIRMRQTRSMSATDLSTAVSALRQEEKEIGLQIKAADDKRVLLESMGQISPSHQGDGGGRHLPFIQDGSSVLSRARELGRIISTTEDVKIIQEALISSTKASLSLLAVQTMMRIFILMKMKGNEFEVPLRLLTTTSLIFDSDEDVIENLCTILLHLCVINENSQEESYELSVSLCACGASEMLVKVLRAQRKNPNVAQKVTKVIFLISRYNIEVRLRCGTIEGFKILVFIIESNKSDILLVDSSCRLVANLCINCVGNQDRLNEVQICPLIIELFSLYYQRADSVHSICEAIIDLCAFDHKLNQIALGTLSLCTIIIKTIQEHINLPNLIQKICTAIVSIISRCEDTIRIFCQTTILEQILAVMEHPQSTESAIITSLWAVSDLLPMSTSKTKENATRVLNSLSRNQKHSFDKEFTDELHSIKIKLASNKF